MLRIKLGGKIHMTFRLRRRVLLVFRHRTFTVFFLILAAARSAIAAVHKDPATNTVHIYYDGGGQIDSYLSKFKALRMSGQRVVIDGTCASACTILLGAIPRNRICVTPNAVLAVLSASNLTLTGVHPSRPGTLYLWSHYPGGCANGFHVTAVCARK